MECHILPKNKKNTSAKDGIRYKYKTAQASVANRYVHAIM